jgi:hypothetical protein
VTIDRSAVLSTPLQVLTQIQKAASEAGELPVIYGLDSVHGGKNRPTQHKRFAIALAIASFRLWVGDRSAKWGVFGGHLKTF